MDRDPYEAAIDQILEGADGDTRLALRIMLVQRLELEARLLELTERLAGNLPEFALRSRLAGKRPGVLKKLNGSQAGPVVVLWCWGPCSRQSY